MSYGYKVPLTPDQIKWVKDIVRQYPQVTLSQLAKQLGKSRPTVVKGLGISWKAFTGAQTPYLSRFLNVGQLPGHRSVAGVSSPVEAKAIKPYTFEEGRIKEIRNE